MWILTGKMTACSILALFLLTWSMEPQLTRANAVSTHGGHSESHNSIANKARSLDDCQALNEVQSSVIRILSTHYDYGKRIHHMSQLLQGLQQDITVFKAKISRLEEADSRYGAVKGHTSEVPTAPESPEGGTGTVHGMEHAVLNLTSTLQQQDQHFIQLDKKYKRLRRTLGKVTATLSSVQAGQVASHEQARTLSHFLDKQKEINGQIINRIQDLESNMRQVVPQQDSPDLHKLQPNGCPEGFVRHFMSCYKFENFTANWIDAEKHCQRYHQDSHLVSVESSEEVDFIVRFRQYNEAHWSSAYIWTGGNDMLEEGLWTWVGTGRPLKYSYWQPGEPDNHNNNQHCIYFRVDGQHHEWDDWHCYAARLNFVCEINISA